MWISPTIVCVVNRLFRCVNMDIVPLRGSLLTMPRMYGNGLFRGENRFFPDLLLIPYVPSPSLTLYSACFPTTASLRRRRGGVAGDG